MLWPSNWGSEDIATPQWEQQLRPFRVKDSYFLFKNYHKTVKKKKNSFESLKNRPWLNLVLVCLLFPF